MSESDVTIKTERVEKPGGLIGHFRIVRLLGEGGFGEVYEAEQQQPVRRMVALKVIRAGMDSRDIMQRFESERQVLALMDHPNIAHVLEAGSTPAGRPFFAMEYVEGEPIAEFCNAHRLSVASRLELFEQVCHAVQHAHAKGVIHRDLKPSNVLVAMQDGRPLVKVIDFGIARALSGNLGDRTRLTLDHQLIGTPLYMSPEQAAGQAGVDIRSDVYSLGVVLYELLTGTTPIEARSLRGAAIAELQRLVVELEPPLPSVRLASSAPSLRQAAEWCGSEPRTLQRQVRGELDWVVMKALEKDRDRRYETVSAFASDVRRFLRGEPVSAAPPSVAYRMRKFARRHRFGVAAASAVLLSLLGGIAAFAWQAGVAQQRAEDLQKVAEFQARMLDGIDATEAGAMLERAVQAQLAEQATRSAEAAGSAPPAFDAVWSTVNKVDLARELIEKSLLADATAAVEAEFETQPRVAADLLDALSRAYASLGLYSDALALRRRESSMRTQAAETVGVDVLQSAAREGELLMILGERDAAGEMLRRALADGRAQLPADDGLLRDLLSSLADLEQDLGNYDAAERLYRERLASAERVLPESDAEVGNAVGDLGYVLMSQGKFADAEPSMRRALELAQRYRPDSETHFSSMAVLGNLLQQRGDLDAAEPLYLAVLEGRKAKFGAEHPATILAHNDMGVLLFRRGRLDDALPYFEFAWSHFRTIYGKDHAETATAANNLCVVTMSAGRSAEAEPVCAEARRAIESNFGIRHPSTLMSRNNLAAVWLQLGRHAEAAALLRPVVDDARTLFADDLSIVLARILLNLGRAELALGENDSARARLAEAETLFEVHPATSDKERAALTEARAALQAGR